MKNLLAVLCGVALLTGCVTTSKSNKPLVAMQDAPEFALENVQGGQIKSAQLKGKVLILDFWATWCGPCRMMAPHFEDAARHLEPAIRLGKVDTDAEPELARQFSIQSIPTLIVFRGGREIARHSGAGHECQTQPVIPGGQLIGFPDAECIIPYGSRELADRMNRSRGNGANRLQAIARKVR